MRFFTFSIAAVRSVVVKRSVRIEPSDVSRRIFSSFDFLSRAMNSEVFSMNATSRSVEAEHSHSSALSLSNRARIVVPSRSIRSVSRSKITLRWPRTSPAALSRCGVIRTKSDGLALVYGLTAYSSPNVPIVYWVSSVIGSVDVTISHLAKAADPAKIAAVTKRWVSVFFMPYIISLCHHKII